MNCQTLPTCLLTKSLFAGVGPQARAAAPHRGPEAVLVAAARLEPGHRHREGHAGVQSGGEMKQQIFVLNATKRKT